MKRKRSLQLADVSGWLLQVGGRASEMDARRNFQSDTPIKKLVRDITNIRAGERKLTETVQKN